MVKIVFHADSDSTPKLQKMSAKMADATATPMLHRHNRGRATSSLGENVHSLIGGK